MTPTLQHARRLWDYMSAGRQHAKADLIVVCCSYDLRVGDYACELLKAGIADRLLFSGNTGNWTRHLWSRPEAHVYRDRARVFGIAPDAVLVEDQSTNFGENIAFSRRLAADAGTVVFITKPASVLRVSLTIPIQWPGITAHVDCPALGFPDDVSPVVGLYGLIDEMVGDLQRVIEYPQHGYQVAHELPPEILESWRFLIDQGFTRHMLPDHTSRPAAIAKRSL
jgi:uncharacterized SAM-binding protein YcdF (DUF218 family)